MKKEINVIISKSLEIEIPDDKLTPEFLENFSYYFFEIRSVDELFEYVATYVARYGGGHVEGVGNVKFTELYEDVESEITGDIEE